jgi:hypothetical protein
MKMKSAIRSLSILLACWGPALCAQAQDTGVKVSIMVHDDGSRTTTTIDPEKHTQEEATFSMQEKLLKRIVFTIDDNKLALSGIVYAANGKPVRKMVYKYDPLNRLTEEQDFTAADQYIGKFVYEYNAKGKVSKIRGYDATGAEVNASPGRPDKKH